MKRPIHILCLLLFGVLAFVRTNASSFPLSEEPFLSEAEQALLDSIARQFTVPEVTVTARSKSKSVIEPLQLSGASLQRLSALNVADALRYFSGVQLKDYGGVGGIKTINIRSMGSQHVGVYYNGIQLGNAQNGQVDLGKFSLDELASISLYHGQKSDIFQSARETGCAGTVYLESRRPYFTAGERVHVRAKMRAGSFALANPSVSVDLNLGAFAKQLVEGLFLTMNGEYVYSDGKYKFRYRRVTPSGEVAYDTTATRQNGDVQALRAEVALHHYYSATGFWRAQGYIYVSERGIPGAIVNNVWRNGERLTDRNAFVQAQWQDCFWRRWSVKLNAKYANDFTHYRNLDRRLLPADNRYTQQEVYLSLAQKVELFRWWEAALAYDFQYNTLDRQQPAENSDVERFWRAGHWLSLSTAFNVQDFVRLQASALMTHIDATTRFTPAVFIALSPLAKVSSPYARALKLHAFYKQSYRYPTFNDLYYTDAGNASLRPELARQHDVGLDYSFQTTSCCSDLRFQVDYYYNRVTDKIIAYPKGQQFRWTMLNLGDVRIHGVDVALGTTFSLPQRVRMTPRLTYTYQQAVDRTSPTDSYYGHQIPYIPLHSGSAMFELGYSSRRGDEYGLDYAFIYVGERYSQQENIVYNYVQPWYTHDLTLFGEWQLPVVRLRAQLEVNNLLGQDYEVIINYPMPKQSFRCTIGITY